MTLSCPAGPGIVAAVSGFPADPGCNILDSAQDVLPVDHKVTSDDLVIAGRDVEARVLAHAIKMFSEQRISLNDGKTVVFT